MMLSMKVRSRRKCGMRRRKETSNDDLKLIITDTEFWIMILSKRFLITFIYRKVAWNGVHFEFLRPILIESWIIAWTARKIVGNVPTWRFWHIAESSKLHRRRSYEWLWWKCDELCGISFIRSASSQVYRKYSSQLYSYISLMYKSMIIAGFLVSEA